MKRTIRLLSAAAAVVLVVALLGRVFGGQLPELVNWVGGQGQLGGAAFVLLYALATVAFLPGSVLTLSAGALFGVVAGTGYVFAGALLGSTAAFIISRRIARPAVERRIRRMPRFARVDRAVARGGRRVVLLLRLSPIMPYNALNYVLGITRVRTTDYLLASVGMLPGTVLYVYSGHLAGSVATISAGATVNRGFAHWLLLAGGFVATIAVTIYITRLARRELAEEMGESEDK